MGFANVTVKRNGLLCRPLESGQVSISRTGVALFHRDDTALVDIGDEVALLRDVGSLRIALRRPRLPEDADSVARVTTPKRAGRPVRERATVNLAPAIRELGLTLKAAAGRWELATKDDLLIVQLMQAAPSGEAK